MKNQIVLLPVGSPEMRDVSKIRKIAVEKLIAHTEAIMFPDRVSGTEAYERDRVFNIALENYANATNKSKHSAAVDLQRRLPRHLRK